MTTERETCATDIVVCADTGDARELVALRIDEREVGVGKVEKRLKARARATTRAAPAVMRVRLK